MAYILTANNLINKEMRNIFFVYYFTINKQSKLIFWIPPYPSSELYIEYNLKVSMCRYSLNT